MVGPPDNGQECFTITPLGVPFGRGEFLVDEVQTKQPATHNPYPAHQYPVPRNQNLSIVAVAEAGCRAELYSAGIRPAIVRTPA